MRLPDSQYDLDTYWGRVQHFVQLCSPLTLFNSNDSIRRAQKIIADYESRPDAEPASKEVWQAKQLVDSSVHPDTGEIIFFPFRMSCNVISNLFVTAGMLTPNMGPVGTVFWQWMNQSLNVAVNGANSNKSHPMSTQQLITNYFVAVIGSCSVALGLNAIVPRLKGLAPSTRAVLGRLVPFAAVVSATLLNVRLMRNEEIKKGITVFDTVTNQPLGTSRIAARRAVAETGLSRAINATPVMILPALVLFKLQQGPLRGKSLLTVSAVNLGLIAATGFTVLPFALAVFPQKRVVSPSQLEPEFHSVESPIWFNRGV